MFYHLYTEQSGQLHRIEDYQAFLNKSNALYEGLGFDNPVLLASTSPDMPESFKICQDVEHAIYATANAESQNVLWVVPVRSGLVAVPGLKAFENGELAGYLKNEFKPWQWSIFARTPAGKAANVPKEINLF
jgi:hypothetical protein